MEIHAYLFYSILDIQLFSVVKKNCFFVPLLKPIMRMGSKIFSQEIMSYVLINDDFFFPSYGPLIESTKSINWLLAHTTSTVDMLIMSYGTKTLIFLKYN